MWKQSYCKLIFEHRQAINYAYINLLNYRIKTVATKFFLEKSFNYLISLWGIKTFYSYKFAYQMEFYPNDKSTMFLKIFFPLNYPRKALEKNDNIYAKSWIVLRNFSVYHINHHISTLLKQGCKWKLSGLSSLEIQLLIKLKSYYCSSGGQLQINLPQLS